MTKEELEKEAEEYADWFWGASPSMMKALAEAYIKGAEPREKRIADLERKLEQTEKDLADYQFNYPTIKELEAQIEKLIDFVLSKTECCDVCPITDTCINSEGTCPYAGILAKGEEEVTREWLLQKIAKEIKEKCQ